MKDPRSLTVIIHTKNEEKNISECLQCCIPIADEVIVVDMQSTDRTVEIARALGAKILKVEDVGYVEPARTAAIAKSNGAWILIVDADERIPKKLQKKILTLIRQDKYDVFQFPFQNMLLGKWIKHSMRWPDYHARLFKKGFVTWSSAVHGGHTLTGNVCTLEATQENAFVHWNVTSVAQYLEKIDRYTSVERYYDELPQVTPAIVAQRVQGEFFWREYEHSGIEDGMHGFITNKLMEYYRFVEFAKYWERSGSPELFSPSEIRTYWPQANQSRLRTWVRRLRDWLR